MGNDRIKETLSAVTIYREIRHTGHLLVEELILGTTVLSIPYSRADA